MGKLHPLLEKKGLPPPKFLCVIFREENLARLGSIKVNFLLGTRITTDVDLSLTGGWFGRRNCRSDFNVIASCMQSRTLKLD